MERIWSSKGLFFGMMAVLLVPYLVYAASSYAGAHVSIWGAVNGANSAHWWGTNDEDYMHTGYSLDVWDITNGEPGNRVAWDSDVSGLTWGNANLSVYWSPEQGHTYKAKAYTQVTDNGGGTLAADTHEDVETK